VRNAELRDESRRRRINALWHSTRARDLGPGGPSPRAAHPLAAVAAACPHASTPLRFLYSEACPQACKVFSRASTGTISPLTKAHAERLDPLREPEDSASVLGR